MGGCISVLYLVEGDDRVEVAVAVADEARAPAW